MESASKTGDAPTLWVRVSRIQKNLRRQDGSVDLGVQRDFVEAIERVLVIDLDYAISKDALQTLWIHGYKQMIDVLQAQIKARKNDADPKAILPTFLRYSTGALHQLLLRLCQVYDLAAVTALDPSSDTTNTGTSSFFINLNTKRTRQFTRQHGRGRQCSLETARTTVHFFFTHIGDLYRYQRDLNVSQLCYVQACTILPNNGHAFNQLAIMAHTRDDNLLSMYLYHRALYADQSFDPSAANIERYFKVLIGRSLSLPKSASTVDIDKLALFLLKLNAHIHFESELATIEQKVLPTLSSLLADVHTEAPCDATEAWMKRSNSHFPPVWQQLVLITILSYHRLHRLTDVDHLNEEDESAQRIASQLIGAQLKAAVRMIAKERSTNMLARWLDSLYVVYLWISCETQHSELTTGMEDSLIDMLKQLTDSPDVQLIKSPTTLTGYEPFIDCLSNDHQKCIFGDMTPPSLPGRMILVLKYLQTKPKSDVKRPKSATRLSGQASPATRRTKVVALRKFLEHNDHSDDSEEATIKPSRSSIGLGMPTSSNMVASVPISEKNTPPHTNVASKVSLSPSVTTTARSPRCRPSSVPLSVVPKTSSNPTSRSTNQSPLMASTDNSLKNNPICPQKFGTKQQTSPPLLPNPLFKTSTTNRAFKQQQTSSSAVTSSTTAASTAQQQPPQHQQQHPPPPPQQQSAIQPPAKPKSGADGPKLNRSGESLTFAPSNALPPRFQAQRLRQALGHFGSSEPTALMVSPDDAAKTESEMALEEEENEDFLPDGILPPPPPNTSGPPPGFENHVPLPYTSYHQMPQRVAGGIRGIAPSLIGQQQPPFAQMPTYSAHQPFSSQAPPGLPPVLISSYGQSVGQSMMPPAYTATQSVFPACYPSSQQPSISSMSSQQDYASSMATDGVNPNRVSPPSIHAIGRGKALLNPPVSISHPINHVAPAAHFGAHRPFELPSSTSCINTALYDSSATTTAVSSQPNNTFFGSNPLASSAFASALEQMRSPTSITSDVFPGGNLDAQMAASLNLNNNGTCSAGFPVSNAVWSNTNNNMPTSSGYSAWSNLNTSFNYETR